MSFVGIATSGSRCSRASVAQGPQLLEQVRGGLTGFQRGKVIPEFYDRRSGAGEFKRVLSTLRCLHIWTKNRQLRPCSPQQDQRIAKIAAGQNVVAGVPQ